MHAVLLTKGGPPEVLDYRETETPEPQPGQARVRLKAAGLNHRDCWQRRSYTAAQPNILGSDGAGIVEAVGAEEHGGWQGREVVINPSLYWGDREDAPGRGAGATERRRAWPRDRVPPRSRAETRLRLPLRSAAHRPRPRAS